MSPQQIALVEGSFRIIRPLGEMAAAIFYQRLFGLDPGLVRMFRHADMGDQGRKLMAAIGFAVANLRNTEVLLPVIRELGRRHAGHGVQAGHYATFGTALLATLEEALGEGFTPELRAAWAAAYGLIAGAMQEATAPARAA